MIATGWSIVSMERSSESFNVVRIIVISDVWTTVVSSER